MIRLFALKTSFNMSDEQYEAMQEVLPESLIPSFFRARACVEALSSFRPQKYDCCTGSCIAYTGKYKDEDHCPKCKTPRHGANGRPQRQFTYLPIIPRLSALFRNKSMSSTLRYRHEYIHNGDIMKDIFDSSHYLDLCREKVRLYDEEYEHCYFQDPRELALGASTDGFAPFNRRKKTCWPILVFNYNLPPEIRFLMKNILCIGVIPGPNKPKDIDSFLFPLIEELKQLAVGVRAYDAHDNKVFPLRAYLIRIFGDIPAMSLMMNFKGHNGKQPCRLCNISGLRIPGDAHSPYYVPLHRSRHPDIRTHPANSVIREYDAATLPLRTHAEVVSQALTVDAAANATQQAKLSRDTGIKGSSILMDLPSLEFPRCFPYDFMHLIYENVLKNLILLWTGGFKGIDEGTGSYQLMPSVWEAVGKATAASGPTIPSTFGASPPDVNANKMACTADTWSFWLLYLGPVLLRKRFVKDVYFKHFVDLAKLVHICIQFEITCDEIEQVRQGFQDWVIKYER